MIYPLLALNIFLLVLGQTLWKKGLAGENLRFTLRSIIHCFMNPYVFTGLVLYVFATVIWLYILSKSQLSLIYPIQSLCYVVAAFVAVVVFKEHLPVTRWVGISLIIAGAYFVSMK